MSDARAFALPDGVKLAGASVAYGPDGETVDVKQLLKDGGGLIVTEDPILQEAIAEMHLLEERDLDGGPPPAPPREPLTRLRKDQLLELVERYGIEGVDETNVKAELIDAINASGHGDVDLEALAAEEAAAAESPDSTQEV